MRTARLLKPHVVSPASGEGRLKTVHQNTGANVAHLESGESLVDSHEHAFGTLVVIESGGVTTRESHPSFRPRPLDVQDLRTLRQSVRYTQEREATIISHLDARLETAL